VRIIAPSAAPSLSAYALQQHLLQRKASLDWYFGSHAFEFCAHGQTTSYSLSWREKKFIGKRDVQGLAAFEKRAECKCCPSSPAQLHAKRIICVAAYK